MASQRTAPRWTHRRLQELRRLRAPRPASVIMRATACEKFRTTWASLAPSPLNSAVAMALSALQALSVLPPQRTLPPQGTIPTKGTVPTLVRASNAVLPCWRTPVRTRPWRLRRPGQSVEQGIRCQCCGRLKMPVNVASQRCQSALPVGTATCSAGILSCQRVILCSVRSAGPAGVVQRVPRGVVVELQCACLLVWSCLF